MSFDGSAKEGGEKCYGGGGGEVREKVDRFWAWRKEAKRGMGGVVVGGGRGWSGGTGEKGCRRG